MSDKNRKFGDDLRDLMKSSSDENDISVIWKEQKDQERKKRALLKEYESTKIKSKQIKKELIHQYTDSNEIKSQISKFTKPLSEKSGNVAKKLTNLSRRTIIVLLIISAVIITVNVKGTNKDNPKTLGKNDIPGNNVAELPKEKPLFELLYPSGADSSQYDVARVSPDGAAPAYTFLDKISNDGAIFRVTQQQIPDGFSLEETSEDFQATSIIQVDENKIHHGYSEIGKVQSLLFLKDELLVTIRSPQKFSDEQWASYYLSLE